MSRTVFLTDHSISSLSGSSQSLFAGDMTRHLVLIVNIGNANIGVNLTGGTAAIGSGGTATIVPNGSILLDIFAPGNAITVIGTSGQPVAAWSG